MKPDEQNVNHEKPQDELEGLDTTDEPLLGWGEYPLDSVFVRTELRTANEVVKRIRKGRYVLDPEFQRSFVWNLKMQSRLIESCLMRIPLPVFYFAEHADGRIIVVDGLQRLTTLLRYMKDEFALYGLGHGREAAPEENALIGKKFSDLPIGLRERIEDTQLTLYILDSKAPERAKLDIFERVNSGAPLSRQQMRNSLFTGKATRWLTKMANSDEFIQATDQSLDAKSMRDREVVNRFCAFRLLGVNQYKADMDAYLAKCLETMNDFSDDELVDLTEAFKKSMDANYLFFGKHAFRKSLADDDEFAKRKPINVSLFDVCSVLFAEIDEKIIFEEKDSIRNTVIDLMDHEEFIQAITYATNGLKQVKARFEMMRNALQGAVSL